jgi:hypothetical protein
VGEHVAALAEARATISRQDEAILQLLHELAHARAAGKESWQETRMMPRTGAKWRRDRQPAIPESAPKGTVAGDVGQRSRNAAVLLTLDP